MEVTVATASLTVVGSGIKFMSHLTTEAKAYIQQSDKVFYLVNEPAMKSWIQKNNINAESLDNIYTQFLLRLDAYNAITNYIMDNLRKQQHICLVIYGHPTVFAKPALDAVIQAKKEGYDAVVLPGISAEACLYADLLINPANGGCQSFEATDLLLRQRLCDAYSHVILWQIGIIGAINHYWDHNNVNGINILVEYLTQFYSLKHPVVIYEAAQYPLFKPRIEHYFLEELPLATITSLSTLYIPPKEKLPLNIEMLNKLNIDLMN